jgi:flagellar basal-body rod protein FlgF
MIRGLWISAGGMTPAVRAQEILANNLANAATGGFRQDRLAFHRELSPATEGQGVARVAGVAGTAGTVGAAGPSSGAATAGSAAPSLVDRLDLSAGSMETTGSKFHLAVSGPGYLVVQGPDGELYTRDGTLQRATDGTLQHRSGYPILSEGGAISVPPGADFTVAADGTVFVDGSPSGKLRVVALPDPTAVHHAGAGLLSSDVPGETDSASRVVQGSLEGANVDPVLTMVDMMGLLRGFEANQKAIVAQDGSLGRLIQWAAG